MKGPLALIAMAAALATCEHAPPAPAPTVTCYVIGPPDYTVKPVTVPAAAARVCPRTERA